MKPGTRLAWVFGIIVASALYAVLVAKDSDLADNVAIYYVALVLTIFVANQLWRKQ